MSRAPYVPQGIGLAETHRRKQTGPKKKFFFSKIYLMRQWNPEKYSYQDKKVRK